MLRTDTEVWKGLSGPDRAEIVERLFALSRGVLEWKGRCASSEPRAWAWYGRLDMDVDGLREDLAEAFGQVIANEDEMVTIDGQRKWRCGLDAEVVVRKLGELGQLLEDWAEACASGKAVAWINVGRLAYYVERMWDQICWHAAEEEV